MEFFRNRNIENAFTLIFVHAAADRLQYLLIFCTFSLSNVFIFSWLLHDVLGKRHLLFTYDAMGCLLHVNVNSWCSCRWIFLLWFVQYIGLYPSNDGIHCFFPLHLNRNDFIWLQNIESFMAHMQMTNNSPTLLISANILPIPAVIMLIVAGRGFIFWCFNILSIPIVCAYAKKIVYGSKRSSDSDERDFQYERSHTHGNDNILEVSVTLVRW